MQNQSLWGAKISLICYFSLVGGILLGSIITGFVLIGMFGFTDYTNLPFPIAFISLPINETIILGIMFLFARYKGANLKDLGLKKISFRTLIIVFVVAFPLVLLGAGISFGEELILGPDPTAEISAIYVMPRDFFQLILMIGFSLFLVGPCEELAIRGFIQRGFSNSLGHTGGLIVTSILFGLMHGLNTLYAIIPIFSVSLIISYIWKKTGGNTTASALLHGIYNSIAIVISYFLYT